MPDAERDEIKVLVVEDERAFRKLVLEALDQADTWYAVREAGTQADASRAVQERRYDVVLLDYRLPDGNGLHFLRSMRRSGVRVPVVMLTGHGSEEVAVESLRAGAADYLTKRDVTPHRLDHTLRKVVELDRTRQRAEWATGELDRLGDVLATEERFALAGLLVDASLRDLDRTLDDLGKVLQRVRRRSAGEDLRDALDPARQRLDRLKERLRLLRKTVEATPRPQETDLDELVRDVVELCGVGLAEERPEVAAVRFEARLGSPQRVVVDRAALRQALLQVLTAAAERAGPGRRVFVETRPEDGDVAILVEAENGAGATEATGRGSRGRGRKAAVDEETGTDGEGGPGHGAHEALLGRTLVRRIVERQGGSVEYDAEVGAPLRFLARLPSGRDRGEDAGEATGVTR